MLDLKIDIHKTKLAFAKENKISRVRLDALIEK